MEEITEKDYRKRNSLKPECEKCFGFCCIALYFSVHDGFPTDKNAGVPCPNLDKNFRCTVHDKLGTMGLKGCIAYECLGAGQQVSQVTFSGLDWKNEPSISDQMFKAFTIMRQLHEMCWYLHETLLLKSVETIHNDISDALLETENVTRLDPNSLMEFNLLAHGSKVNTLLRQASNLVRSEKNSKVITNPKMPKDFFGKDLRKKDLRYQDLRGACLIAANLEDVDLSGTDLIGADLRDANLNGANLSESIFLTQFQINVARGNTQTKLPTSLLRPINWV